MDYEAEKDSHHIITLEEQFLAIQPGHRSHDDAPDAVEGAVFILNQKNFMLTGDQFKILTQNCH